MRYVFSGPPGCRGYHCTRYVPKNTNGRRTTPKKVGARLGDQQAGSPQPYLASGRPSLRASDVSTWLLCAPVSRAFDSGGPDCNSLISWNNTGLVHVGGLKNIGIFACSRSIRPRSNKDDVDSERR